MCSFDSYWPTQALEQRQKRLRNEPRARRIEMTITLDALAVNEKALGNDEVQIVPSARHRDIKQATFLFQFLGRAGA